VLLLVLLSLVLLLRLLLWVLSRSVPFLGAPWIRILSVPGSFVYKAKSY
jgi:hypothetical protein